METDKPVPIKQPAQIAANFRSVFLDGRYSPTHMQVRVQEAASIAVVELLGHVAATLRLILDAIKPQLPDVPENTCERCGRVFQEGEQLRFHEAEPCQL